MHCSYYFQISLAFEHFFQCKLFFNIFSVFIRIDRNFLRNSDFEINRQYTAELNDEIQIPDYLRLLVGYNYSMLSANFLINSHNMENATLVTSNV